MVDVDTTMALRKPEMRIQIDRERASDLGVSVETVASTLRVLVGGQIVSDFRDASLGELYDVWLRTRTSTARTARPSRTSPSPRRSPGSCGSPTSRGSARRPGHRRSTASRGSARISLVANLNGIAINQAQEKFMRIAGEVNDEMKAGPEYVLIPSGRAKVMGEMIFNFLLAFGFSLAFMYMILAAQFESFVHPVTILLAVPITIPFALLSLIFLNQPMSMYGILGMFLLFGIVKKNGILQVDYTNVLRGRAADSEEHVPEPYRTSECPPGAGWWVRWVKRQREDKRTRLWAIVEANRTRLRPILMTTLMLISGMIPIAMGAGPGAASRAAMAKVIIGGQAMSLLLSLLVTPVAYSLFDDLSLWRKRKHPAHVEQAPQKSQLCRQYTHWRNDGRSRRTCPRRPNQAP